MEDTHLEERQRKIEAVRRQTKKEIWFPRYCQVNLFYFKQQQQSLPVYHSIYLTSDVGVRHIPKKKKKYGGC